MDNIFNITGISEESYYIGRKDLIKEFKEIYCSTQPVKQAKAIIGLPKTGKTSFKEIIFSDLDKSILYIDCNLKKLMDNDKKNAFFGMWNNIARKISKYVRDNDIAFDEALLEELMGFQSLDEWSDFCSVYEEVFNELSELKIKVIIVLEHFDYAKNIFKDRAMYEVMRDVFSDYNNVSSLIISRSPLHEIEGKDFQASSFAGVVNSKFFNAFSDDDVNEFYKAISDYGIELSSDQIKQIEYYTGRSPRLCCIMGYYIIEAYNQHKNIDIEDIFKQAQRNIDDYCQECIKHLTESDYLRKVLPFTFGARLGVKQIDIQDIKDCGYLREIKDKESDEVVKNIVISEYFMTFLTYNLIEDVEIWSNLINAELQIKKLIRRELTHIVEKLHISGDNKDDVLKKILQACDFDPGSIDRNDKYIRRNKTEYDKETDYIYVMSLKEAQMIVKKCWIDIFGQYFENKSYEEWGPKFDLCVKARNPFAHGNIELLNEDDTYLANLYCEKIIKILNPITVMGKDAPDEDYMAVARANMTGGTVESNESADTTDSNTPTETAPIDNALRDEILGLSEIDFKVATKGVRKIYGTIQYNNAEHRAIITKNIVAEKTELLEMNAGDCFKVKPYKFNQGQFEVKPIE